MNITDEQREHLHLLVEQNGYCQNIKCRECIFYHIYEDGCEKDDEEIKKEAIRILEEDI